MSTKLKLINLMEKLKNLFDNLLSLSNTQLNLLEKGSFEEGYEQIIEKRQSLQPDIEKSIAEVKKYEQEIQKNASQNSNFSKGQVIYAGYLEQKNELKDIISLIQANDSKCQALLIKGLKNNKGKIGKARQSKKALQYYNHEQSYTEAWFFDKKR